MTDKNSQFLAIDIQLLRTPHKDIGFDVFLKLGEDNFAHVFSKTTGLDFNRLASYLHKGVKEVYIRVEDEKAYQDFLKSPIDRILQDPQVSSEKKIALVLNMTEQNMAEIFTRFEIPEESLNKTQSVVKNYVELMSADPHSLAVMLRLVSHGEYLYSHSVAVSIFSILLAKAAGTFNQRMTELIGMGAFLHDIGCTQISREILDSPRELTPEQWVEIKKHPSIGLQMIEKATHIPKEVKYIIYQHHEEPDGTGYPNGIREQTIFYPSKIVAVADAFSALISKRPFRNAYSVSAAIQIMRNEPGKYNKIIVDLAAALFLRSQNSSGDGSSNAA